MVSQFTHQGTAIRPELTALDAPIVESWAALAAALKSSPVARKAGGPIHLPVAP